MGGAVYGGSLTPRRLDRHAAGGTARRVRERLPGERPEGGVAGQADLVAAQPLGGVQGTVRRLHQNVPDGLLRRVGGHGGAHALRDSPLAQTPSKHRLAARPAKSPAARACETAASLSPSARRRSTVHSSQVSAFKAAIFSAPVAAASRASICSTVSDVITDFHHR